MLPEVIEISPVKGPVRAEVTIPGSKSITNRALILAALGTGATKLEGALWSEDTEVMSESLGRLGVKIEFGEDAIEPCNRAITVHGAGGRISSGGTRQEPLELFVGNAGTAARFLTTLVCLGRGVYRLSGVARMHERPQEPLFRALRALGYRIEAPNDRLPALVFGEGPRPGSCSIDVQESSQFASALLLCARRAGWTVQVEGGNAEELPYVELTEKMAEVFPKAGGTYHIEADASSAGYFWAADHLLRHAPDPWLIQSSGGIAPGPRQLRVRNGPTSDWQVDSRLNELLTSGTFHGSPRSKREISRSRDLGDSIMIAAVLAPFWSAPTVLTDLGRLRVQECERVRALRQELEKCGGKVIEKDETLTIHPSRLHGAEIETYNDHRMAMCFATVGLEVPGIRIRNPACVKKTFPDFYEKLALAPPHGIGAVILNAATGAPVARADLFAD